LRIPVIQVAHVVDTEEEGTPEHGTIVHSAFSHRHAAGLH